MAYAGFITMPPVVSPANATNLLLAIERLQHCRPVERVWVTVSFLEVKFRKRGSADEEDFKAAVGSVLPMHFATEAGARGRGADL